ncbi:tubulin-like doman-containing protein [Enhygromyxa salina]|uniref:Tubulin-like protein CetZ n=1 Tax=Enhygromyxa salina TaxID=215803 RepID=A0A2S9YPV2_9BACT|nr:tubulin-like doman-containing protein [Enhygromyxa salina]PRQ07125.1 Tubulin-like protein CetZ [Enhygromyxa salina]
MPIRIMPGEVTPTLFVGLGGSGGRAVGRIAKRLRSADDFELQYRNLVRFVAIDTNDADLARLRKGTPQYGKVDETVLISDFDKVAYSKLRRGESFADADPYFTQWIHDWYQFREESGAGAGQIRIESRLSMFRAIESADMIQKLSSVTNDLRSHLDGMRHQSASIQVFVYFSVAGGTGSGGFLPFAYMMRDILDDRSARLIGFAILPEAFESVIGMNRDGIYANSYAALKEVEHLMKLDTQYPVDEMPFHYDPRNKHKVSVSRRPYDLVYLVDRPQTFSLDDVGEALADATYVQIFSPIIGDQQADYDNYTKENRRLFPDALWDRKEGYSAFFGTLGSSVMVLPRHDLLEYCARRYAATAVRRYVLLDDPALISPSQREQFKRFALSPTELAQLSDDAKARRIDENFGNKIRLLAAQQGIEGGIWARMAKLPELARSKFTAAIDKVQTEMRDQTAGVREISADRILDGSWTPAASLNALQRQVAEGREKIDKLVQLELDRVATGDWWTEFLAAAGPDEAPELNLYEQRFVLLDFRDSSDGPLAPAAIDELRAQVQRLASECELGSDGRFRGEMNTQAAELKRTYGGWDKLITRKDKDFEAARDRAVSLFNDYVDKIRAWMVKGAALEFLGALGRAAEHLRRTFRDIESSAGRLAQSIEEDARRYEFDGGIEGLRSEANEYALDVELLQHPSARLRFWSWYYTDQIESRAELQNQDAVLVALREALRPRFDDRGETVRPDAGRIVGEIVDRLIVIAKQRLEPEIVGDAKAEDPARRAGLRIDDALALEAAYYGRHTDAPRANPVELLEDRPLSPAKLWKVEQVRTYARRKLDLAINKAQPLSRYQPELRGTIKHPNMLLVGLHESLRHGIFHDIYTEATGSESQELEWPDSHRIVFYRSILGVPLYCFPHINDDMKAAYRRFQGQREQAWPLHIDHHWERLPDLDPEDRRRELEAVEAQRRVSVVALALGLARGVVEQLQAPGSGTRSFSLRVRDDRALPLGEGMLGAADALFALRKDMPAVFDGWVQPLLADVAAIDEPIKAELKQLARSWGSRLQDLELDGKIRGSEYRDLNEARTILSGVVGD